MIKKIVPYIISITLVFGTIVLMVYHWHGMAKVKTDIDYLIELFNPFLESTPNNSKVGFISNDQEFKAQIECFFKSQIAFAPRIVSKDTIGKNVIILLLNQQLPPITIGNVDTLTNSSLAGFQWLLLKKK